MKTPNAIAKKIIKSMDEESIKDFELLNDNDKVNFIKNKVNRELLQNVDIDFHTFRMNFGQTSFFSLKCNINGLKLFLDNLERESETNKELFKTYKFEWDKYYDYPGEFILKVTGTRLEKNKEYNVRVREILEEVKSLLNISGSSKKIIEEIERKEKKYQHYLEMKKWVEETGLTL